MDSYFEKGIKLKGTLWVKGAVHFNGDFEGEETERILTQDFSLVKKESRDTGLSLTRSIDTKELIEKPFITKPKNKISKPPAKTRDVRKISLKNNISKKVK